LIVVFTIRLSARPFTFKNIVISGNNYLEEDVIKDSIYIKEDENLVKISFEQLESRIKRIAWVNRVSLRKQFPHTLMVQIEEAVPKALLRFKKRLFLISSDGRILEELKQKATSFLPVMVGIDPKKDKGGVLEALMLIDALDQRNVLSGKESIEITLKSFGLMVNMDGQSVKIGYGEYGEKLDRWKELEAEIRKQDIMIDYVDLRFKDKVIVKPMKKERKG
jgi:cell division protein FtsQ